MKPMNKAGRPAAELAEPRPRTKGNADQQSTHRTQGRARVIQALDRVRKAARQRKKEQFTSLLHHMNVDLLRTAFYALKRTAAPGVDGMMWADYEADLEPRLEDLQGRVHRGAYRPRPSRRTYIPKADGKQRPLAIAALEDKIVQGAIVMLLNAIYEGDFCGFSYGFRPGRGPHDALDALSTAIKIRKVNWILDADIQNFFGAVSQDWLVRYLEHRIGDKRIIHLIQKWLRAGILEDGVVTVDDREAFARRRQRCVRDMRRLRREQGAHGLGRILELPNQVAEQFVERLDLNQMRIDAVRACPCQQLRHPRRRRTVGAAMEPEQPRRERPDGFAVFHERVLECTHDGVVSTAEPYHGEAARPAGL